MSGDAALDCSITARLVSVTGSGARTALSRYTRSVLLLIFTTIVISDIDCTRKRPSSTADIFCFRPACCSFRMNTKDPSSMTSRRTRTLSSKFFLPVLFHFQGVSRLVYNVDNPFSTYAGAAWHSARFPPMVSALALWEMVVYTGPVRTGCILFPCGPASYTRT